MITGITTAPPIKVVVPHTHVSKPFELAPTSLSPVQSSEDTQIHFDSGDRNLQLGGGK